MTTMRPPTPINPWTAHAATVLRVEPEVAGVATYSLRLNDAVQREAYRCAPGRFNMLYLPGVGESAISVSGYDAGSDAWLHTVRTAGSVTRCLEQLRPGGQLALRGPFGTAWPLAEMEGRDVIFVAGGIGLAPLRPAIEWALDNQRRLGRITLVYGARTPSTLLYQSQYADWTARGLHLETTVDRAAPGWLGNVGVVPLLVDRLRPLVAARAILLCCGPDVMMRYTIRSALERGLAEQQMWLSLERNMQCAVGFCGHCQLGPAFICKDGPVLRLDRVARFIDVEQL
jgi:NAD(P)H-flavin reductase